VPQTAVVLRNIWEGSGLPEQRQCGTGRTQQYVRCCCPMSKLAHFSNSSTVAHFKTNLGCVKRLLVQNLTINLGSRARFVACGQTGRQTDRHVAASNTGHNAQPDNSYGALRSLSIDTHVSPQTLLNRFTRNFIYRKSSVTYILVSIKRPNRR